MPRKQDVELINYMGLDLSTQKLKAVILDEHLNLVTSAEVHYDTDMPEYRTSGGVNNGPMPNEYFVSPTMWIKALDIVLERLILQGANFGNIACISGSAQQHGSIYWNRSGINILENLDADKFLHSQLDKSAFSITYSPIWMDSSTGSQCIEMEIAIGGSETMLEITGSRCYPRFTGPQIRKIYQKRSSAYENTEKITLVSNFLVSLLLGFIAPMDFADASGMNLFDINEKKWSKLCLNSCAPDLEQRLPEPIESNSVVGPIAEYYVKRFGFNKECKIVAATGDNPSALSGMVVEEKDVILSMGTSDTLLMNFPYHPKMRDGHVFCHPFNRDHYMGMLCFRNGSLTREYIKDKEADGDWETFNKLLESTPRGNFGNMGIYFKETEILPPAQGFLRWTKDMCGKYPTIKKFSSPQFEIRALIEGQMIHHKAVAVDLGFVFDKNTKIIATGGASINKSILQVVADVFNAPVYTEKNCEAALMGAAYRAKYALYCEDNRLDESEDPTLPYETYIKNYVVGNRILQCEPSKDCIEIYTPMMDQYRNMSQLLIQN